MITGAILAGGAGSRLKGKLPDHAKTLAPIQGQPFLHLLLRQLPCAGVHRAVLCTGYRGDQVRAEIGDLFEGMPVLYSKEEQPLGTGGALRLAWTSYGDKATWLVMNGDSYLDIDLTEMIAAHRKSANPATIAAVEVTDGRRFGSLEWDPGGQITAFREKSDTPGARWINGGVYLFEPQFLDALPRSSPLSLENEIFPAWLGRGLHVFNRRCRFIDIGTPESYSLAQTFFGSSGGSHSAVRHSGS